MDNDQALANMHQVLVLAAKIGFFIFAAVNVLLIIFLVIFYYRQPKEQKNGVDRK